MVAGTTITSLQSRVARTYLDWTQQDLGQAAGIDRSTVRSFENGYIPRRGSILKIRKAFERHGIEFTEDDGVARRASHVKLYRGSDSRAEFYDDVLQTVTEEGGDIRCILPSQASFMRVFGMDEEGNIERLEALSRVADIRCLVADPKPAGFSMPKVQFRVMMGPTARPDYFLGFGEKYANAFEYGRSEFTFVVFHIGPVALSYRDQFLSLWVDGLPLAGRQRLSQ